MNIVYHCQQWVLGQNMQAFNGEEIISLVLQNAELTYIFQSINWPLNTISLTIVIETLDTR